MNKIIFPPRPKSAVPPKDLDYLEKSGVWCVQPKYNGSRAIVLITPDRKVAIYSRHGRKHLNYSMPTHMEKEILALPGLKKGVQYWLDGELLLKTVAKDTKGKLVLFDVLQKDKYFFLKPNQLDRIKILDRICGSPKEYDTIRRIGYSVSDNVLMAPTFFNNFKEHFKEFDCDEVEGLVLRKKNSVIDNYGNKEYLVSWILRCRKSHENYQF